MSVEFFIAIGLSPERLVSLLAYTAILLYKTQAYAEIIPLLIDIWPRLWRLPVWWVLYYSNDISYSLDIIKPFQMQCSRYYLSRIHRPPTTALAWPFPFVIVLSPLTAYSAYTLPLSYLAGFIVLRNRSFDPIILRYPPEILR